MRLKRPLKDKTHCQLRPPEGKSRRPLQRRRQKRAGGTPALRKAKRDPCPGQAGFGRLEANAPASLRKIAQGKQEENAGRIVSSCRCFCCWNCFWTFCLFCRLFPSVRLRIPW